jgi:hypothetical protein
MTEIVYEDDADLGVLDGRSAAARARKYDLVGRDSGQYRHRHG